jgi:hypothetical protein
MGDLLHGLIIGMGCSTRAVKLTLADASNGFRLIQAAVMLELECWIGLPDWDAPR